MIGDILSSDGNHNAICTTLAKALLLTKYLTPTIRIWFESKNLIRQSWCALHNQMSNNQLPYMT